MINRNLIALAIVTLASAASAFSAPVGAEEGSALSSAEPVRLAADGRIDPWDAPDSRLVSPSRALTDLPGSLRDTLGRQSVASFVQPYGADGQSAWPPRSGSELEGIVRAGDALTVVNAREVNLRMTPGYLFKADSDVLTTVVRGQVLYVIWGPVYVDGLPWWRVRVGAEPGWIAERTASGYRLLARRDRLLSNAANDRGVPETHLVQGGDTAVELSNRFRVTVASIMRLNGLASSTLWPGQRLLLPPPELLAPVESIVATLRHVYPPYGSNLTLVLDPAEPGPTVTYVTALTSIAYASGVSAPAWQLQPGQLIEVVGQPDTLGNLQAREVYILETVPHLRRRGYPVRYVVQRGDTLELIAKRFGVSVEAIRLANGLYSRQVPLAVGQALWIP